MKHIIEFKTFEASTIRNPYIDKKSADRKQTEFIGDIQQPVEIRIDVEAIGHALSPLTFILKTKQ